MDKLANVLTDFCMSRNNIPIDRRDIYCYGFKLIISDIINFTIVLVVSLILSRVLDGIVFLITLCSIRKFSGGFHAKTFGVCRISMIITFVLVLLASEQLVKCTVSMMGVIMINLFSILLIARLAPVIHPNKVLTTEQRRTNKIKSIITSLIMSVISISLVLLNIKEGVTISITLLAVVILMIVSLVMHREVNVNV